MTHSAEGDVAAALVNFAGLIQAETLATTLQPGTDGSFSAEVTVGGSSVTLNLRKV